MNHLTRRQVLRTACGAAVCGSLASPALRRAIAAAPATWPTPTPAQLRWQDCELGVIYHLDMPLIAGDVTPNNATKKTFDPALYNPTKLDTDQWIDAAKAAGARYAIFTATHFNGFMQWQSDLYPYSLMYTPWRDGKGDIVADFVESCRKADILPGIYLSTHRNAFQTVWGHYVNWGKGKGTPAQAAYNRIAQKQTEELCSRYGPLVQIWYDAGVRIPHEGGPDVLPIFEKHQPDSVFYHCSHRSDHRWIGNEQGHAGDPCWATMPGRGDVGVSHNSSGWREHLYHGVADGPVWSPGMVDIVLRGHGNHDWFWQPGKDHTQYPVDDLLRMYDTSVGRNCNLIIGLVVDNKGLVPDPDVKRMEEFGRALRRRFSRPIGQTSGQGDVVSLKFDQPRTVDQVVIQEDITYGERIRRYVLEGHVERDVWRTLAEAQCIGHKCIHWTEPTKVDAVRIRTTERRAEPIIRRLEAFAPTARA